MAVVPPGMLGFVHRGDLHAGNDSADRVAVVIPVRDGAETVADCVAACWRQSSPPHEVVVVDNGSSDDTAARAAAAGARVVHEPEPGSYRARNAGWRSTTADIIVFTDVDCVPRPDWLRRLVEPFAAPEVAAVGGSIVQHELRSATQRWMVERRFLDQAFNASSRFMPFFATANAAYRRSVLEALQGFDEIFRSGGDNDLSWRVQALTRGVLVFRPEAQVVHQVGRRLSEITSRARRYAAGDYLLERRWSGWPGWPERGGFFARTRRVWQLPLALGYRLARGKALSVPFIDAAVDVSNERGWREGRRRARALAVGPLPVSSLHRTVAPQAR